MSRSKKKPIWKDKSNHVWYNRIVRRMQVKQIAQLNDILEYKISQPNELVNDWDICDWKFDYRHPFWKQFHTPAELKRFCCMWLPIPNQRSLNIRFGDDN